MGRHEFKSCIHFYENSAIMLDIIQVFQEHISHYTILINKICAMTRNHQELKMKITIIENVHYTWDEKDIIIAELKEQLKEYHTKSRRRLRRRRERWQTIKFQRHRLLTCNRESQHC